MSNRKHRKKQTTTKTRLGRYVVAIVSTTLTLLIVEAFLRLSPLSDSLGWTRNSTDEERISRISQKRPGELRILGLGDSFSDYRDSDGKNYLRIVGQHAKRQGIHLSLVNLSHAGTGIRSYRHTFRTYSKVVEPDIVTIGIYLGNDIEFECPKNAAEALQSHSQKTLNQTAGRRTVRDYLKQHSVLINTSYRAAKLYIPWLRSGAYEKNLQVLMERTGTSQDVIDGRLLKVDEDIVEKSKADQINSWSLPMALIYPDYYTGLYLLESHAWQERLGCHLNYLTEFGKEVRRTGAEPVFILIPDSIVVAKHYHRAYYERLGFNVKADMHAIDPVPLVESVKRRLTAHEFKYVDLLPSLRQHDGDIYIPIDLHFNNVGQALAGKIVFDALLDFGLISVREEANSSS